ncbi:MAG: 1-acyl-sn-glycerol-3-phosphate acyltransferase [Sphingobacteriales bacterium]|nr:MAG: 1-acyl-sn-glycerol-3-phosphate acyltransferase [Sphingobacteriales bacterium]
MRKLLQPVYTIYVLFTFVVCLLVAFPLFLIIGLWDKPWARRTIWNVVHYWALGWLVLIGMPMRRKGFKPTFNQRYVIVANHISYMDTIDIYAAIPSYFRTLAKKEMAAIPIFGYVYKQLTILVDRSSTHSRSKSLRLMWRAIKNESHITVFPEGTFNEGEQPLKEFFDGAFRLAINTQVPVLPLLLPDTVDRWHYSGWYKLWPGRNRAIFMEPIPTEGMTMADLPALKAKAHELMSAALVEAKH